MWLRYGVDADNSLVGIEDVPKGKSKLKCPYCGGGLTAKKGKIKEHHFAHTEETCHQVAKRDEIPVLPLYDNFNIQLSGNELEQLKIFWREYESQGYRIPRSLAPRRFVWLGLLQEVEFAESSDYEFTKLGQVPFGQLSLMLFNEVQEPLLLEKLSDFEQKAFRASETNSLFLSDRLMDLRLYRAQLKNILLNSLYFLEVEADGKTLHKIGITKRPIEERLVEVERDLSSHFKRVSIKVLGIWSHRGNVEKYFKHRYQEFNHPIGSLTEYYQFASDRTASALGDLQRMKPKVLSQVEIDILEDKVRSL